MEVQEVAEENAADKEVPDSISKNLNISKGNDPADEKAESEKSTVQHMTKTSIKKKRLSTGKKSKLEKISEKSPKSDASLLLVRVWSPQLCPARPCLNKNFQDGASCRAQTKTEQSNAADDGGASESQEGN